MGTDAIIYQSVLDGTKPVQQLSNLALDGLSTRDDTLNSDHGRLYGSFVKAGNEYILHLYSDVTKLDEVASATATSLGLATVVEANESGLSGSVNFIDYQQDDTSIEAVCFLSKDSDLPMANLEGLSDYDPLDGFAAYHLLAFEYLKQFAITRVKTLLWSPDLIDTRQINGGTGGYDYSRILNWACPELREASAHYAFYRVAERQAVEDNTFMKRAAQSKNIVKANLQSTELQLDQNQDRVEDASRSLRTWRVGRA